MNISIVCADWFPIEYNILFLEHGIPEKDTTRNFIEDIYATRGKVSLPKIMKEYNYTEQMAFVLTDS